MKWYYQQAKILGRTRIKVQVHEKPQHLKVSVAIVVNGGTRKQNVENG